MSKMKESLLMKVLESPNVDRGLSYAYVLISGIGLYETCCFIREKDLNHSLIFGAATIFASGMSYYYNRTYKLKKDKN